MNELPACAPTPFSRFVLRKFLRTMRRIEQTFFVLWVRYFGVGHPKNHFDFRSRDFLAAVRPGERIADLGCGTGNIAAQIHNRGNYVLAVDHDISKIRFPVADKLEMDLRDPGLNEQLARRQITTAVLSHILEHIPGPVEFLTSLKSVGRLLICVPSRENWRWATFEALGLDPRLDGTHEKEYSLELLRQEVEASGFKVTSLRYNGEGEIFCEAVRA